MHAPRGAAAGAVSLPSIPLPRQFAPSLLLAAYAAHTFRLYQSSCGGGALRPSAAPAWRGTPHVVGLPFLTPTTTARGSIDAHRRWGATRARLPLQPQPTPSRAGARRRRARCQRRRRRPPRRHGCASGEPGHAVLLRAVRRFNHPLPGLLHPHVRARGRGRWRRRRRRCSRTRAGRGCVARLRRAPTAVDAAHAAPLTAPRLPPSGPGPTRCPRACAGGRS